MKDKKKTPPAEEEILEAVEEKEKTEAQPADEASVEVPPESTVDEKDDYTQEIVKFRSLFGEISPDTIPDSVWDEVRAGQSLCAAFALYLFEEAKEAARVREINDANHKKAPGRISTGGGEEYFSPEAVRAMDEKTVRKQYEKIMRSMEHWN